MPDSTSNIPVTPPATAAAGFSNPFAVGDGTTFANLADPAGFFSVPGQVQQCPAYPATQGDVKDPGFSTKAVAYGKTANLALSPITPVGPFHSSLPDPNKHIMIMPNRYLSKIKEKKGIANLLVLDKATGNKQYQTASFIASEVTVSPSESASLVKTNEGFTLYSPDSMPTTITLNGYLLSGEDWSNANKPGPIMHTDWFSKLLSDYQNVLSSTAAISNNTDIWFSYEYFFANVFITGLRVGTSADSPTVHDFSMQMIVKSAMVITRSDLDGSGKDAPGADPDKNAAGEKDASKSNGTGTAPSAMIGGANPAIGGSFQPINAVSVWAPDNRADQTFTPQGDAALAVAVANLYKDKPV